MFRPFLQLVTTLLVCFLPATHAAAGSFTVSPSIGEVGAGITVTYTLEDYTPYVYDIIAIYASGEVSVSNGIMHTEKLT